MQFMYYTPLLDKISNGQINPDIIHLNPDILWRDAWDHLSCLGTCIPPPENDVMVQHTLQTSAQRHRIIQQFQIIRGLRNVFISSDLALVTHVHMKRIFFYFGTFSSKYKLSFSLSINSVNKMNQFPSVNKIFRKTKNLWQEGSVRTEITFKQVWVARSAGNENISKTWNCYMKRTRWLAICTWFPVVKHC